MNMKKTAIATAVGATLVISGVAQADGHSVELYGRINNVVSKAEATEADGTKTKATNMLGIVSRIGVKASAPINADLTAFGRYEFSVTSDSEGGNGTLSADNDSTGDGGIGDTRIAEVGVRGDWGYVKGGNMWSTFYNMVGTHMDPSVTLGAVLYSTVTALPYRVSNAIQYGGDFGPVSVSAEVRIADKENPDNIPGDQTEKIGGSDGTAIGASWMIIDGLLLAVAIDQSDSISDAAQGGGAGSGTGDVDRTGVAVKYTLGNYWGSLSYGETDEKGLGKIDQTQLHIGGGWDNGLSAFLGYGMIGASPEVGSTSGSDPKAITLNVTKKFGTSGFRVYYEMVDLSGKDSSITEVDYTQHILGARIDF